MSENTTQKDFDFFISYSNADAATVEPIVKLMAGDFKARCWFQLFNSKQEYVDEIIKGIESSAVFVIFVSKNSALSNNVLNEIHYALSFADSHPEYKILPVVIDKDGFNINDEQYRKIRFYLNRFNMLFYKDDGLHDIVFKIFEQADYVFDTETLKESLYHTGEIEYKRLRAQNEILKKASNDIFCELVSPASVILDVGCESGANIMLKLDGIEYKHLLGVDISEESLAKATEMFGSDKNKFINCDITTEAFYDVLSDYLEGIDSAGFDLIHISSVLLHQTEPVKILKTLKRFLKSSGHLFIQDEDDGANIVHPAYPFFDKAFNIWLDSKESGDRHCARKIPSYLKECGYKSISLRRCGISNIDLTPEEQDPFWDIYFNHHLWEALSSGEYFYNYKRTKVLIDEYIAEYDKRHEEYLEGKIFIQLGFLIYVAKK